MKALPLPFWDCSRAHVYVFHANVLSRMIPFDALVALASVE
jgi:hypothetical protein